MTPTSAAEVAAALRDAADARRSILIRGAGTKIDWGRPPGRVDAEVDMRGLNRLLAHEHGDMTATVEAGARLADVNRALAAHGQWLPLDPPHADAATIGGILATNDSGPLRHRYGTPRDLLIGVQLATTDGVLAKAGGRVVKNVAGYDLGKLVTGSFGSLAAIVSATFKLSPRPATSKTVRIALPDVAALADIVRTVMASQLEPMAFEFARRSNPPSLDALLRFASLPSVVDAQIERAIAATRSAAAAADVVDGDAEHALWREHADATWRADASSSPGGDAPAVVRASWLPANVDALLAALDGAAEPGVRIDLNARAAFGAGLMRIAGGADAQARVVERLRASPALGNVVIVRGSAAVKQRVDVWGPAADTGRLFAALKRALDPHNVLNAGRGPL